jgi:hypothetical protein
MALSRPNFRTEYDAQNAGNGIFGLKFQFRLRRAWQTTNKSIVSRLGERNTKRARQIEELHVHIAATYLLK